MDLGDTPLILASRSPRRAALLRDAGVRFETQPCPLDEPAARPAPVSPRQWAAALAYYKARAVADAYPSRVVLGADTVVVCAGRLLGKPADVHDARRMLRLQAGRACDVITGVSLVRAGREPQRAIWCATTRVWMRDAPDAIEAYLASGEWAGKAGAYGIQDAGDRLVERIEGSFANVVGLPVEHVQARLARF